MSNWEIFEKEATNYLNIHFKLNELTFKNLGSSDSTLPDIEVYRGGKKVSTIEAKYSPSQSGQIVVISDGNKFIFSETSKNKKNRYTDLIIEYINQNFKCYKDVSSGGLLINIDNQILFNWIKTTYKDKGVSWIVSSSLHKNLKKENLLFIPLSEMEKYFTVSAKFRRKKSGTAHLPQSDKEQFIKEFNKVVPAENYQIQKDGKKFLLKLTTMLVNKNIGNLYFLTATNTAGEFYIKKKSNTNNPNVMFSLELNDITFKDNEFIKSCHL